MNRCSVAYRALLAMSRRSQVHLALLVVYIALVPVAFVLSWLESVTFVSLLSVWALVVGQLGAWEASRPTPPDDEGGSDG